MNLVLLEPEEIRFNNAVVSPSAQNREILARFPPVKLSVPFSFALPRALCLGHEPPFLREIGLRPCGPARQQLESLRPNMRPDNRPIDIRGKEVPTP